MTEQAVEETQAVEAPPAGPIQVSWAGIPRVNLLPLEVVEGRRFRRTQAKLGVVVAVALLATGGAAAWAHAQVGDAQDDLDRAQAQVTTLNGEQAKYSAVPQLVAQVEAADAARTQVMAQDVLWYRVLNDMEGALPSGVSSESIELTVAPVVEGAAGTGEAAAGADPLTASGLGTVAVTGKAPGYDDVSALMESLDKVNGIDSPALTGATKSQDTTGTIVTYSINAVLTDKALSHRFDAKEGS